MLIEGLGVGLKLRHRTQSGNVRLNRLGRDGQILKKQQNKNNTERKNNYGESTKNKRKRKGAERRPLP